MLEVLITEPWWWEEWNRKYEGIDQFVEKWEKEKGLEISVRF